MASGSPAATPPIKKTHPRKSFFVDPASRTNLINTPPQRGGAIRPRDSTVSTVFLRRCRRRGNESLISSRGSETHQFVCCNGAKPLKRLGSAPLGDHPAEAGC